MMRPDADARYDDEVTIDHVIRCELAICRQSLEEQLDSFVEAGDLSAAQAEAVLEMAMALSEVRDVIEAFARRITGQLH